MKKCVLVAETNVAKFGSLATQLHRLGRKKVQVRAGGNCLFESVAIQVPGMTHQRLRQMACDYAAQNEEEGSIFLPGLCEGLQNYQQLVQDFRQDGYWHGSLGYLMPVIIFRVLGKPIVKIRHGTSQVIINDNGNPINDDSIVIIQDVFRTHYDAAIPSSRVEQHGQQQQSFEAAPSYSRSRKRPSQEGFESPTEFSERPLFRPLSPSVIAQFRPKSMQQSSCSLTSMAEKYNPSDLDAVIFKNENPPFGERQSHQRRAEETTADCSKLTRIFLHTFDFNYL